MKKINKYDVKDWISMSETRYHQVFKNDILEITCTSENQAHRYIEVLKRLDNLEEAVLNIGEWIAQQESKESS